MSNFCYNKSYKPDFIQAVRKVADAPLGDPTLHDRLREGTETVGQLEYQLRVNPQQRLDILQKHAPALASSDKNTVLSAAAALTSDLEYLNNKAEAHKACLAYVPPRYIR